MSQFIFGIPAWSATHLCDFIRDVVCAVFDLGGDDGFLRGWRRGALPLIVGLREVEGDQGNLVDGAVLIEVGVRSGAKQAGLDLAERS